MCALTMYVLMLAYPFLLCAHVFLKLPPSPSNQRRREISGKRALTVRGPQNILTAPQLRTCFLSFPRKMVRSTLLVCANMHLWGACQVLDNSGHHPDSPQTLNQLAGPPQSPDSDWADDIFEVNAHSVVRWKPYSPWPRSQMPQTRHAGQVIVCCYWLLGLPRSESVSVRTIYSKRRVYN
jgi:hypothetical protein